jgi:hypothetical protein
MEKKMNVKIDAFVVQFKNDLKKKMMELNFTETEKMNEFLEYLNEYEHVIFQPEDIVKRSRVQNVISGANRCTAKLQNDEQCTRRKKNNCQFCGTHTKNLPFGSVDEVLLSQLNHKINVFTVDVQGILYYIDEKLNVYKTEDIIQDKINPRVVAKATCENGVYHIPLYGI